VGVDVGILAVVLAVCSGVFKRAVLLCTVDRKYHKMLTG
jgi:hypothetical protein